MEEKFKKGDKVRIKTFEQMCKEYPNRVWHNEITADDCSPAFVEGMKELCGRECTFVGYSKCPTRKDVKLEDLHRMDDTEDVENRWVFSEYMIEKIEEKTEENKVKIIFNNPATILFVGGEKFVSKAHNEQFDKEKGLLMCLAKANGYTHLQIKKMINGAVDQAPNVQVKLESEPKKKVGRPRKVNAQAVFKSTIKVGDKVKLNKNVGSYKKGKVGKVMDFTDSHIEVKFNDMYSLYAKREDIELTTDNQVSVGDNVKFIAGSYKCRKGQVKSINDNIVVVGLVNTKKGKIMPFVTKTDINNLIRL